MTENEKKNMIEKVLHYRRLQLTDPEILRIMKLNLGMIERIKLCENYKPHKAE